METQENHTRGITMQYLCLYLAPVLSVAVHGVRERETLQTMVSNGIFMVLLASIFLLFIRTSGRELYEKIEHTGLFWGCYFFSFLLLGVYPAGRVGVLWLLAVAFAALEAGVELSISLHLVMMTAYVVLGLLAGGDLYNFAVMIFFGLLLAMLFSLYRKRESTLYLAVILLAVYGVLQLALYRLNMSAVLAHRGKIAAEMAGILLLVLSGYCYLRYLPQRGQSSREEVLGKMLGRDFPLARRLREFSPELYRHCRRVAELSGQAARAVEGDVLLSQAGGMYHEIGRIRGEDDYIQAGLSLGEEESFPEELLAVIRQHSPSSELPGSPEAAVVMLSDCILSTSDYLVKNGLREKLPDERLVHNVFQNRLSKGNLGESGLTPEQIKKLEKFYISHAFEKGDKV